MIVQLTPATSSTSGGVVAGKEVTWMPRYPVWFGPDRPFHILVLEA